MAANDDFIEAGRFLSFRVIIFHIKAMLQRRCNDREQRTKRILAPTQCHDLIMDGHWHCGPFGSITEKEGLKLVENRGKKFEPISSVPQSTKPAEELSQVSFYFFFFYQSQVGRVLPITSNSFVYHSAHSTYLSNSLV
ncbi:unnamed protein product [Nippostrongylus brasiliensis]|uniref:Uncharacterized protein n=1 Tax=Nippostrongylus brasiliensis TaxID=27835 RepID=A0A0N4YHQ8_NIPBR|nr:unnamed protein product [Nippostrongylus brasiliensis]